MRHNRFLEALRVQDACNLSGVARTFIEVIDDARTFPLDSGAFVTSDPAVILFAYKISTLCGSDHPGLEIEKAWEACTELSDTGGGHV